MSASTHRYFAGLLVAAAMAGLAIPAGAQVRGPERQRHEVAGMFKSADAAAGTITVTVIVGEGGRGRENREPPMTKDETYPLAKNAELAVAAGGAFSGGGRGAPGLFKEIKLAELAPGVRVGLSLAADDKTVESVVAEGPMVRGQLKAVDAGKNSVTILLPPQGERGRDGGAAPAGEEKTFTVTPDAEIAVDDGRGGRFTLRPSRLADLAQGSFVTARLAIDLKQIQFILAEGPTYQGAIKAIEPTKNSLTLTTRPARGDDAGAEHSLTIATDALVLVDDGRGRRLSVKQAKLTDVPVGATATVRLSADQSLVTLLRVEGPMLIGQLKGVDAAKGVITIAIPKGRGEEPEEKSLTIAKDAPVWIDGAASTLANLKAGDTPQFVQLRLSLDQKTVQAVQARQAGSR